MLFITGIIGLEDLFILIFTLRVGAFGFICGIYLLLCWFIMLLHSFFLYFGFAYAFFCVGSLFKM
jgi:hypothetical protein